MTRAPRAILERRAREYPCALAQRPWTLPEGRKATRTPGRRPDRAGTEEGSRATGYV